jgi:hypothetical protein
VSKAVTPDYHQLQLYTYLQKLATLMRSGIVLVGVLNAAAVHAIPPSQQQHTLLNMPSGMHAPPVGHDNEGRAAQTHTRALDTGGLSSDSSIPMVVYYTGPTSKLNMGAIWGRNGQNQRYMPDGMRFRFFDDASMLQSAKDIANILDKEAGVHGAYSALKMLRPIAFRVDLWRAMILWEHGGIYMDADVALLGPLDWFVNLKTDKLAICEDAPNAHPYEIPFLWNAMIAARRRSPEMLAVIKAIVANVQGRVYPGRPQLKGEKRTSNETITHDVACDPRVSKCGVLDITGPGLYGRVLAKFDTWERHRCVLRANEKSEVDVGGGTRFFNDILYRTSEGPLKGKRMAGNDKTSADNMHSGMKGYHMMFYHRQIYCDEGGHPCDTSSVSVYSAQKAAALQVAQLGSTIKYFLAVLKLCAAILFGILCFLFCKWYRSTPRKRRTKAKVLDPALGHK